MKDKSSLRLAYIISAYKLPDNLCRLINALDESGSFFIVGVDKNTCIKEYERMRSLLERRPNVHFLERHRSPYRSFGHVTTTIKGLEYLRTHRIDYDYVSLLTGQDYPIKSLEFIRDFLTRNFGKSFIDNFSLPDPRWTDGGLNRIERYYVHKKRIFWSIPRKYFLGLLPLAIPGSLRAWGGSGYWTLHRSHADYCVDFLGDRENKSFIDYFRHTDISDELFFQTILMNSTLTSTIENTNLRYIDWSKPRAPSVLLSEDWEAIKNADGLIFGRKFDMTIDSHIMDLVDDQILSIAADNAS